MPDERKRNLIVSPVDKDGTYTDQKYQVINALDYIVRYTNFIDEHSNACKLLPAIIRKLKARGVWKYITSLTVLREYSNLQIEANSGLTYISKEFIFRSTLVFSRQGDKYTQEDTVRLVIILKSMEEANKGTCDNSCKNQGSCFRQPYSSTKYCQCKPYYQ
ncbi:---NA---, partial [Paramuricea clavata]